MPGSSRGRGGAAQGWDVQGSCPARPGIPSLATHKRNRGKHNSKAPGELLLPYPAPENSVVFEYKCKILCQLSVKIANLK